MSKNHLLLENSLRALATGFWASQVLSVATELDLFSKLAGSPMTVEELNDSLGTSSRSTTILLTACTALGLLNKISNRFHNSALADQFLVRGKTNFMGPEVIIHPRIWQGIGRLKKAILNDAPTLVADHQDFYQSLSSEEWIGFAETMHSQSLEPSRMLLEFFDFSQARTVMDIGGGLGSYTIAILQAYPQITAILIDLPPMRMLTEDFIRKHNLESRVEIFSRDFFTDELPCVADVVLLSRILHDYNAKQCKRLLSRCFKLLPKGGSIIVHEEMLNEEEVGPLWPALLSVSLLTMFRGAQIRSVAENRALLRGAGFVEIRTSPVYEISTFISAKKPS